MKIAVNAVSLSSNVEKVIIDRIWKPTPLYHEQIHTYVVIYTCFHALYLIMSGGCSKCGASAGHGVVLYQSGYIFPRTCQADNNCLNSALKRLALIVLGH